MELNALNIFLFFVKLCGYISGTYIGLHLLINYLKQINHFFTFRLSYNCIYYYGKIQIFLNKCFKTIMRDENKYTYFLREPYLINDKLVFTIVTKFSGHIFNLFGYFCSVNPKRIIYNNVEDNLSEPEFEPSNIQFMLIEFIVNNQTFKIDLKTNRHTYYIVGNRFTKDFFIYYIKTHLKEDNLSLHNNCRLVIIDHDVNNISIDFTDKNEYIKLEKDSYQLCVTNHK